MSRYKRKLILTGLSIFIAALLLDWPLYAQTRTHNLGDFKLRIEAEDIINTNDVDPTGEWPQDYYHYANIVFYNSAIVVGRWVDSTGTEHLKQDSWWPVSYNQTEPYGIKEYRRSEPPEVWVYSEGQLLRSSRRFTGTIDPNLPVDEMIEVHYKAEPGFDVIKRSYSYSNPDHNDYVIHYCRYLCTFDWDQDPQPDTDVNQTLENVYFLIGYSFQTQEGTYLTYSRWYEEAKDDWATYETFDSPLVPSGRQLQISYGWDGDYPDLTEFETGGQEFDDTGDPRWATGSGGSNPMPSGELVSAAYQGFAALHVDATATDHADDPNQPTSIIANISIYNVWDSDFGYATVWDWAASGTKQTVEDQSGWPDDASAQEDEFPIQAFGPYNFTLGDSVVIVYAVGVNGISRQVAVEKGLEWRDWYRGVEGATFDNDAKNALLATGKDSLFASLDRANWAWNNGLNIPDPLPAPNLTVTSGPLEIYLEWQDMSQVPDFDTGLPDLDHYVIYRKMGSFLCDTYNELNRNGTHLVWEKLVDNIPGDQTRYTDTTVVRGQPYHYAVTAVDEYGLESSIYANRSEIAAYAFEPGRPDAKQVRIVPNPFILKAEDYNFGGDVSNRLLFANLPPYCTLRIFTAAGDLIKTIDHLTGSADESWDQITKYNQQVASGVYILQIDNAKNIDKKPIPGSIEKFVIIR